MRAAAKAWCLQVLIALDQLVGAVFGGWADETMSSRLYRLDRDRRPWGRILRPAVDAVARVLFRQQHHCCQAYAAERARSQCPPEERTPTLRSPTL